jgi:hypothetical protein
MEQYAGAIAKLPSLQFQSRRQHHPGGIHDQVERNFYQDHNHNLGRSQWVLEAILACMVELELSVVGGFEGK